MDIFGYRGGEPKPGDEGVQYGGVADMITMLRTFLRWNTVLSAFSIVLLVHCAFALLFTYDSLNYDEGWGFVFVIALSIIGGIGLLVDLLMRLAIAQRATINKAQAVVLLLLFLAVAIKLLAQA